MKPSKKPSKKDLNRPRIVVIGGGTGTFVVLSGLKNESVDLTAIVTVADSGGSSGRLRDEFGFLPVGDFRQSLAALAQENDQSWIRELLLYRFSKGRELKGHNLGNLILTALQEMAGSTPYALEIAGKIFRLDGRIYPSTIQNVQLVTSYTDGTKVVGEHHLDEKKQGGKQIKSVSLKPEAKFYGKAAQAIKHANLIILGPGDLYGSLIPNLVAKGAKVALRQSQAKIVYIVNLMTRYTQTHHMTAKDHVEKLSSYMGRQPDVVIVNTGKIPPQILTAYGKEHEFPVTDDLNGEFRVIRGDFVSTKAIKQKKVDVVQRSLLRHDQQKLTQAIMKLL